MVCRATIFVSRFPLLTHFHRFIFPPTISQTSRADKFLLSQKLSRREDIFFATIEFLQTAPRLIEFFGEFDTYQVLFLSSNPSLVVFFFSRRGVSSRSLRLPSPVARVAQQENLYNAQTLS